MLEVHSQGAEEDGLPCSEVGAWAEDKYRLVALYDELFSTAMKNKWDTRVYLDLYAGPGFAHIKGTQRIIWGSPLRAMGVADPFDKYIFSESEPSLLEALRERVKRLFPAANVQFVLGDCNAEVGRIAAEIPRAFKDKRVLSLCVLDPFDISIKFSAVQKLSHYYLDFLLLLALHMDANRNLAHYVSPRNRKIDEFLGLPDWRTRWKGQEADGVPFPHFLASEYSKQMESLGYLPVPFYNMKEVRSDDRNLPLYRLALFSRHKLAYDLWEQVLKYSTNQTLFDFNKT